MLYKLFLASAKSESAAGAYGPASPDYGARSCLRPAGIEKMEIETI